MKTNNKARRRSVSRMFQCTALVLMLSMVLSGFSSFSFGAEGADAVQAAQEKGYVAEKEAANPYQLDAYYEENTEPENGAGSAYGSASFSEIADGTALRIDGFRKAMESLEPVEDTIEKDTVVDAIIVLDGKSLLERGYEASEIPQSFWAGVLENWMNKKQDKIADEVLEVCDEVEINYYYTIGICGIGITTPYENIETLKKIDGVKDVILSTVYDVPEADESNQIIGAAKAWADTGYTGKGTKIAVIDTGLDLDHPSFQAAEGFTTTDSSLTVEKIDEVLGDLNVSSILKGVTAKQLYRSSKVPFAFNYIDASLRADHNDSNASDHGTHVAGIAAANQIGENSPCGVAPDAQILVMKVFGNRGGAYFSDIMAAVEDAIRLECDSVNISIGSAAGFTDDEQEIQEIFARLCDTDVVVAVAAGNDYNAAYGNPTGTNYNLTSNPDFGLVSTPGVYANATTVASMDNAAEFFTVGAKNITFNDSAQSDSTAFMKVFSGGQQLGFAVVDNYGASKSDFEEAEVAGKIALVQRGGNITFTAKQENAQAAGAVGVIVYNSMDGTTSMKINDGEGYIPCISVSKTMGEYMIDQYYNGVKTLTIGEGKTGDALGMSTFSSWGTTSSLNLKPDITAVGGSVLSTVDGGGFGTKSGTSMASPQIAGAAALIKQYLKAQYPGMSQDALHARTNALLLSTAVPGVEDTGIEFSPRKQGAGLVNVANALGTDAYLSVGSQSAQRPKAELGDDPQKTGNYHYTFSVNNMTKDSLAYKLSGSLLTSGYREEGDGDDRYYLMGESDIPLDGEISLESSQIGYYYDVDTDETVDTRDIRTLMLRENYTNREGAMADIDQDGDLCDDADIMLFLDNLSGLKDDVDLETEALIVPGSGSASVDVSIQLADSQKETLDQYFPNGTYVEGYAYLTSLNSDGIGLSLPYMGFYGDWAQAPIFDAQDYHYETSGKVNSYGTYLWTEESILGVNPYVETPYDPAHNAISDMNGLDVFETGLLRNAKRMSFTVTDEKDNVLYSHEDKYVTKSLYSDSTMTYRIYRSPKLWDGTDEEGEFLPNNAKVNLHVEAQLDYKDKVQTFDYPITIDTEKPELLSTEVFTDENGRIKLKASFKDNQYISAVIFKSANGSIEYDRYGIEQKEAGETITDYEFDVTEYDDDFMMILSDYAMNQVDYDIDLNLKDNGVKEPAPLDQNSIYGFNMGETANLPAAMVKAPLDDVSKAQQAAALNGIYAAEYIDGYVIALNALKELSIYTPQGTYWSQSKIKTLDCDIYDMAFNYADQKLYAITYHDEKAYLSTIDIYDGTVTDVAPFGKAVTTLACTTEGQLYCLTRAGEFCTVNSVDASTTVIGKVSETEDEQWVALNYRQSMTYDHNTGKMYWYAFCYNGTTGKMISHLSEIDMTSGKTEVLGQFDQACEVSALFVPYDGSLEIEPADTVTGVTVDKSSVALFPGQEVRIFAAATPWNAKNTEIEWTSSDETVATVVNGRIKGISSGDAVIYAKAKGTDVTASCKVKVLDEPQPFYGYQLLDWHDGAGDSFIQIDATNPIKYKRKAEILSFIYAGEYVDGYYYCYDSNGYFYRVDTEEWLYNTVGKADGKVVEMTYDYVTNTMYGISSTGHSTALVRIDMNTGETTEIGPQDKKIVAMTSVPTGGDAENGFTGSILYGINENSQLVRISKEDGSTSVDPNSDKYHLPKVEYVQSMTYDYNTGYIYWAQVYQSQNSSLYIIDLDEHDLYYVGVIGKVGSQVAGLVSVPKEGTVPEIPYVELEGITLNSDDCIMVKGSSLQLRAKTVPYNASSRKVQWKSDNPDVANVNASGEVKGYNVGTATITCTAEDEQSKKQFVSKVTVTVTEPIENLTGFLLQDYATNNYNAWININPVSPMLYNPINASVPTITAGTYYNGWLYGYDDPATGLRNFYKIDPQTGEAVKLGTIKTKVADMAFDYSTGIMYGITDGTDISMIDLANGETYPVFTQKEKAFVAITVDVKGTIYVIGREKGSMEADAALYQVDLEENSLIKIGETGQKAVLDQSMTYDFDNGYIYWAQAWARAGEGRSLNLCIVNPKNGYASVIGKIGTEGAEVSALHCESPDEPQAPYVRMSDFRIVQGDSTDLLIGGELQLQMSTDPVYATNKDFTYTVDAKDVISVSKDGLVKAEKEGKAVVTVSVRDGDITLSKTIEITVHKTPEKMHAFLVKDRLFDEVELNRFISFTLEDSEDYKEEEKLNQKIIAADRYNGSIYAYTSDLKFIKIDEETKSYETLGTVSEKMGDMAFDYSTGIMYGVTYSRQELVQIDLENGNWYTIGSIKDASGDQVKINSIACDEDGTLYGMTSTGGFYSIDGEGKAKLVGETMLSSSSNYESDLTYDPDTKMLYWSQISAKEQSLYIIFPKTGAACAMYPIGEEGAEVSLLYADSERILTVPEVVAPKEIALSNTEAKIASDGTLTLNATVLPVSVSTDKTVTWESSNSAVASVDQSGKVTGIKEGTAVITVKTADGTVTASCEVTVTAKGKQTYGYDITNQQWISFDTGDLTSLTKVADGEEVACAAYVPEENMVYAYLRTGRQLVKFDPDQVDENGSYTYENVGATGSNIMKSLVYDEKADKLYAISQLYLFEINRQTGAATKISSKMSFGLTPAAYGYMYTMAISGEGTIYSVSRLGALAMLEQTTGLGQFVVNKDTAIASGTLNASGNSLWFDENDDLYWAATGTMGSSGNLTTLLYKVNAETGAGTYLGSFGGDDVNVKIGGVFVK